MLQEKGKVVLDLGPSPGNPRNSEGAFIELRDGRLMFAYSKYTGDSFHDNATAGIAVVYSEDGGESWYGERTIASPEAYGAQNLMSVSLLRMANREIGLFYLIRKSATELHLYLSRSDDEGETWGKPICCMAKPGYHVVNNDRVIRLSSGRLIIPAALHNKRDAHGQLTPFASWANAHFFLSDDDGFTWREAQQYGTMHAPHSMSGLQEPGVIELKDGTIWSWSRTDMGRQYEMFSTDGGETWSESTPSPFTSPRSPLSMKRVPHSGELLAIWNPIPNYHTRQIEKHSAGRTPLIGAISRDDGKTWGDDFAVELAGDRGYSYTAIHFKQDAVLLGYCAGGRADGVHLARLRIRKILLHDIGPGAT